MLLITWGSVQRQILSQWVWVGPELHVSVGGAGRRATPRADTEPGCTGVLQLPEKERETQSYQGLAQGHTAGEGRVSA